MYAYKKIINLCISTVYGRKDDLINDWVGQLSDTNIAPKIWNERFSQFRLSYTCLRKYNIILILGHVYSAPWLSMDTSLSGFQIYLFHDIDVM